MRNRRLIGIARPRGQRGGRGRRDDRWGGGIGRSAGGRGIIDARVGRELRGGGCHFSSVAAPNEQYLSRVRHSCFLLLFVRACGE